MGQFLEKKIMQQLLELPCMQAGDESVDGGMADFAKHHAHDAAVDAAVEELDSKEELQELRKRGCYAKLTYQSMPSAQLMPGRRNYELYAKPAPLQSEHAVICITCLLGRGTKLVAKIPQWCMSPAVDTLLPKVYDGPRKIVLYDPTGKDHAKRFVTPKLVILYTVLLQGHDLERETPRKSSQPISCQALDEGYRVMISDTGDQFYGQTNTERAICMIPSTRVTKAQILSWLNMPAHCSEIEIRRFATWESVKDYCCGGELA